MRRCIKTLVFSSFVLCTALALGPAGGEKATAISGAPLPNWSVPRYFDCKSDCNAELKRATKECNVLYPVKSRSDDNRDCLKKAKDKYDACVATCKA